MKSSIRILKKCKRSVRVAPVDCEKMLHSFQIRGKGRGDSAILTSRAFASGLPISSKGSLVITSRFRFNRNQCASKLKDTTFLSREEPPVVLKNTAFFQLQQSAGSGRLQFYRNRQEPVPWINRAKHGRFFRALRTTNERRAYFGSKATEEILQSYGVALKLRQKRKSHMLPNADHDLSRISTKLERASWNTAKERRQRQPSNPQPSVLGFVKPGAAYRADQPLTRHDYVRPEIVPAA